MTLTINPTPTATISGTTTLCEGDDLALTAAGGTTYAWSGPNSSSTATISVAGVTTADGGTYTVTVTDGNGCTATATTSVTVTALPTITISSPPSCSTDLTNYSLSVTLSNGAILTTTLGAITANGGNNFTISTIPIANNVVLTATIGTCEETLTVNAPNCNCPTVNAPDEWRR